MSVQPAGDDHHDHVHRTPHQDQQQARSHIQDANTAPGSASSAQALGRLARDLQQQLDPQDTLQHVAEWAVQTIPGAQHVSVSLVHRRREITSAAATGDVARRFDELQQEVGQGPCLMAMYDHQTMRVEDLATDERWPLLAQQWAKAGARSALCLQLFVQGQDLGALNVLSEHVGAFDDESEQWGLLVASHAAVAVAGALKIDGLGRANLNRTVIGQAEGILMERFKINGDVAFALLSRISQDRNRKLHLVAEDLVRTGEVPAGTSRG